MRDNGSFVQYPASVLFKNCQSIEDKLNVLAELYVDARTWRAEEAEKLKDFEKRLAALESKIKLLEVMKWTAMM